MPVAWSERHEHRRSRIVQMQQMNKVVGEAGAITETCWQSDGWKSEAVSEPSLRALLLAAIRVHNIQGWLEAADEDAFERIGTGVLAIGGARYLHR